MSSTFRCKASEIPRLRPNTILTGVYGTTIAEKNRKSGMTELGKLLVVLGIVLVMAGVVLTVLGKTNLPLGRLPGDIVYRGKNTTFYFPLATSVLVSVVLSIVLYVVGRWRR
jgi:formate hydrogenlyase subunit 3/multisubunit Na+/H+ antiporter MnhD subunit